MPESVKKTFVIFTYFVLILITLLVFWQVCNFNFVNYDDDEYVYENPDISNGLSYNSFIAAFTKPHVGNWLPLTWLSFILDCQLFGLNPGRMHLVNVLLHLANTLLLFAVLKKMTGALWQSAFVAAVFAIHPMHVESVAWITERKDVLSTFFLLLTLAAYVNYVRRRNMVRYLLTVLPFAAGLLAKPMLVTLPFLLLLLDYWPLERIKIQKTEDRKQKADTSQKIPLARLIIEKIPFFILAAASSVITFLVQRSSGALTDTDFLPLQSRFANAFLSYAKYIGRMFWPENLAVFYRFGTVSFAFWQVTTCVLLLLVISILVIRFGRQRKYLPVGWFWFVAALLPVIGLIQSGAQSMADRYTYIPYIGLFIMTAWGLPELLSELPYRKPALGISMVIMLTALGVCAHRQVSYWNNSIALFSHAIEVTQNNDMAYNNRGVAYDKIGRYQDAIEDYKQALRIKPDYARAYFNLGVDYGKVGHREDEVECYKQAIRIRPDYTTAYCNLGAAYDTLGRYQDAVEAYKHAIQTKPDYINAHYNLGIAYAKLGRRQDEIEAYKQVIRVKPDFVLAHYNLGVAYLVIGDKSSSLEEYKILKTLDAEKANELLKLISKQ